MFNVIKLSTAITARIGPFLSSTDGVTPNTGLGAVTGRYYVGAGGGTGAALSITMTHDGSGMYTFPLTTTHSGTVGLLRIYVVATACVPVWEDFMVVSPMVYDSLCAAADTDYLQVDVKQWLSGTIPAVNVTGVPLVDNKYLLGTIHSTPATAGIQDVNIKNIANAVVNTATAQIGVNAVQWVGGTIPAVAVTGVPKVDSTYLSGTVHSTPATAGIQDVNIKNIANAVVNTANAQIGTNAVSITGSAVDTILDEVVEGTLTMRQVLMVLKSVLAGKSSGGGTLTIKFRDTTDAKDRVTASVDASGNRTGVTLDVT